MFQALNPTEPRQTWMLRALTCLISVNPRELSAYLGMECNYFTCIVELVPPPLVHLQGHLGHLCTTWFEISSENTAQDIRYFVNSRVARYMNYRNLPTLCPPAHYFNPKVESGHLFEYAISLVHTPPPPPVPCNIMCEVNNHDEEWQLC